MGFSRFFNLFLFGLIIISCHEEKRNANIEELEAKNNTRVLQGLAEDFMDAEEIEELLEKAV